MKHLFSYIIFFSLLLVTTVEVNGKNKDSLSTTYPLVHTLWITTGADYVAPSVNDDLREKIPYEDKIKINSSVPVNLKYSFTFTDPQIKHYLPGGYQGIALGILNYGSLQPGGFSLSTKNIGYPVLTYLFQGGPFYHIKPGLTLNYEWNFGASYGWKPYSEDNKYFSLTVGSHVNAYLHLGISINWQLTKNTGVFGGIGVSHFSNGNTSFPNPGVNSFGVRFGMFYNINPTEKEYKPVVPDTIRRRKLEYDISLWGATRKRVYKGEEKPVLLPGHFPCAGVSFAPMVRLNSWWRVGGSFDLQWDKSSDMKRNYISGDTTEDIKFTTPSFWRQVTVGISAHGELRMPIFAVNIGCGYNFIAPWENRGTYQNITLKTYIGEVYFINVGYQLRNFHQQSSLMLGAGVTI